MTIEGALHLLRGAVMDALYSAHDPDMCRDLFGLETTTRIPLATLRGIIEDLLYEGLVARLRSAGWCGYALTGAGRAWVREQTGHGA